MRAITVSQLGGPEVLVETDTAEPSFGLDELLVRVEAIGVNYIDTYFRRGIYKRPVPYTPGDEGAGVVIARGSHVTGFAVGDRVAWAAAPASYAEEVAVPAAAAVKVPAGVEPAAAASALLQGMTAHYLAYSVHRIEPGQDVLIHAGAGGVGLLLTQMAKMLGARVITTVSTEEKERLSLDAGADDVLRYRDDLAEVVRGLTGGAGVDVVYDGVGKDTFEASLASLKVRGMLALFGASSGPVPPFDPQRLNGAGSLFLTRPTLAHYTRTREELDWRSGDVLRWLGEGKLKLRVGATYPLADAARAHADLQARKTTGSVVLIP
jgi:NADPH2:quinone reductase